MAVKSRGSIITRHLCQCSGKRRLNEEELSPEIVKRFKEENELDCLIYYYCIKKFKIASDQFKAS